MKKIHVYKNNFTSFFDGDLDVFEINREKLSQPLTTDAFIKKAKKVHGDKFDYSKVNYKNRSTNIIIICKEHDVEFFQLPTNHLSGWLGCPCCSFKNSRISMGERQIKKILNENNIDYVYQKRFEDCKNQKTLRFDFWLPKYKIIIEYDGQQHYKSIDFFGGVFSFERLQNNDKIKNEYAMEMGYKLLRISYLEYSNISKILKNNIKELN